LKRVTQDGSSCFLYLLVLELTNDGSGLDLLPVCGLMKRKRLLDLQ
jgi:hypothetical protein